MSVVIPILPLAFKILQIRKERLGFCGGFGVRSEDVHPKLTLDTVFKLWFDGNRHAEDVAADVRAGLPQRSDCLFNRLPNPFHIHCRRDDNPAVVVDKLGEVVQREVPAVHHRREDFLFVVDLVEPEEHVGDGADVGDLTGEHPEEDRHAGLMPEQQRKSHLLLITTFFSLATLYVRVGNSLRGNPRGIVRKDFILGQSGDTGVEESFPPARLLGELSKELRHLPRFHCVPVRQEFSAYPRLEEISGIRTSVHPMEGNGEDLVGVVRSPRLREIIQQTGLLRDRIVDRKFSHKN